MAQDDADLEPEVAYSSGSISGEPAGFVDGTEELTDGLRQAAGWSVVGIPIEMDDPRVSGQLTFVANGSGQDFDDGFAKIESKSYRLENEDGAWTGSGDAIVAVTEDVPLMDLETAVLVGDGEYEGLLAFFFAEFGGDERTFEIVVIEGERPPVPDPVSAPAVEDVATS